MEHRDIEERDLARLYCVGKLSQEESLQFETHFVDCPACLERLELLRSFRNGLKQTTGEDAALPWSLKAWSLKGWSLAGLIAWLAALRAWKRATVLAGAACLVIVLPASLSFWKIIRLRQQLESTKLASAGWEQRYAQQLHANDALQKNLPEATSQASAAIFSLSISRGAPGFPDSSSSQPVNQIAISRAARWVAFSLEGAYGPNPRSYRATLNDAHGRLVWQESQLVSATPDSVGVVLPASLFESGDYLLMLETQAGEGHYVNPARYRFRVHVHG